MSLAAEANDSWLMTSLVRKDDDTDVLYAVEAADNGFLLHNTTQWIPFNAYDANDNITKIVNGSETDEDIFEMYNDNPMPQTMIFSEENLFCVIAYLILFVIAGTGNLTVFLTLFRNRHKPSKVNLFIMHLCMADMIVTFIMMPLEIVWNITISWRAGDFACRVLMFFRAFGFYLSSFILIAISIDRYFAITRPLSLHDCERRGRIMLALAWVFSVIASTPQSVIFHTEQHPEFREFFQCVTHKFFPSPIHEHAYNLFNFAAVYIIPLLVIIVSYTLILCEISQKTGQPKEGGSCDHSTVPLRRSCNGRIQRAKQRTLRMTLVIVSAFIVCWTPYYVMSAWYWFHHESARVIDRRIQKGLFLFAVSNSCVNPIIYGVFTRQFRDEFKRCCCLVRQPHKNIYTHAQRRSQMKRLENNPDVKPAVPSQKTSSTASMRMRLLKRMDSSITLTDSPPETKSTIISDIYPNDPINEVGLKEESLENV